MQSTVARFPEKLEFEHRGARVWLTQTGSGVHWKVDRQVTIPLDGIEPDMASARNKAIEMIDRMVGK